MWRGAAAHVDSATLVGLIPEKCGTYDDYVAIICEYAASNADTLGASYRVLTDGAVLGVKSVVRKNTATPRNISRKKLRVAALRNQATP
jgi:hypothetical protein